MPLILHLLSAIVFFSGAAAAFSRPCDFEAFEEYADLCESPSLDKVEAVGPATADHSDQVLAFAKYAGPLALVASAESSANEALAATQDNENDAEYIVPTSLSASLARELASPENQFGEKILRSKAVAILDFQNARVLSKMIAGLVLNGKPPTVYWYVGGPIAMIDQADLSHIAKNDDYFVIVSETCGSVSLGQDIHAKRDFNRYFGLCLR